MNIKHAVYCLRHFKDDVTLYAVMLSPEAISTRPKAARCAKLATKSP
jgi:hypothetical protein